MRFVVWQKNVANFKLSLLPAGPKRLVTPLTERDCKQLADST